MALGSDLERLVAAVDAQLAVDGREVVAHGAGRDMEGLGDLRVGEAALGQAQDLDLSLGEGLIGPLRSCGLG